MTDNLTQSIIVFLGAASSFLTVVAMAVKVLWLDKHRDEEVKHHAESVVRQESLKTRGTIKAETAEQTTSLQDTLANLNRRMQEMEAAAKKAAAEAAATAADNKSPRG